MTRIERIVDFMVKRQGQRFTMRSDDNCFLYTADGRHPLNRLMTVEEIEDILTETLPQEQQPHLKEQERLTFPYSSPQGTFTLQVTRRNGSLRVSLWRGEVTPEEIREDEEEGLPVPTPFYQPPVSAPAPAPPVTASPATVQPPPPAAPPMPVAPPAPSPTVEVSDPAALDYLLALFEHAMRQHASDLHLRADTKPFLRVVEKLHVVADADALNAAQLLQAVWQIAPQRCQQEWAERGETCFGYDYHGRERFRCHVFQEHRGAAAAFRLVPAQARTLEQLGCPEAVKQLSLLTSGLVIVSGLARSGKSTTLAAVIEHINQRRSAHVVTLEAPIEFVHHSKQCLITQREVPTHVPSFAEAWRGLLRMDADVCVIGELHDSDSLSIALDIAEQGRLVLATLPQPNTSTAVGALLQRCPAADRERLTPRLVRSLQAVIAQTLCCDTQGGQVAAFEVLVMTPPVAQNISEGKLSDLESSMWGRSEGMVSLNDSLLALIQSGRITLEEALRRSLDPHGLKRLSL